MLVRLGVDGTVRDFWLRNEGDYLAFGPGVPHTWEAPDGCTILTVRIPSRPDDEIACDPALIRSLLDAYEAQRE